MAQPLVEVHQQAIPFGIPTRGSLKIDGVQSWEARRSTARAWNARSGKISVFEAGLPFGIVDRYLPAGIRLVHIEEASQMHTFGAQEADIEGRVLCWLEVEPQTGLDSIGRFVIFVEAHDHGITEEATPRHRATWAKSKRSGVRIGPSQHVRQGDLRNVRGAREGKQTGRGIE